MVVLGIDIGRAEIKAGMVDEKGAILASRTIPTPPDLETFVPSLHTAIGWLLEATMLPAGVGVGCKGIINPDSTQVEMISGALHYLEGQLLSELVGLPRDVPVVVLEPGCLSVFRDELPRVIPDARLPAMGLAEFLADIGYAPPRVEKQVLLHGHCHQKALFGLKPETSLLKAAQCEILAPDTGCCGMAGSFGYRPEFYETSKIIAGLALLPALQVSPEATVVADGFSCREQIEGLSGRRTLHLAELLAH